MTLALQQFVDALPEHCAVLDRQGVILCANAAWQAFAAQNAAAPAAACGIGANYFAVCENAHQSGGTLAGHALAGMRSVLAGLTPAYELDYPCHSTTEARWFRLRVLPLADKSGLIALHANIGKQVQHEASQQAALHSAEDASHAKSFFLTSLSHEMRTPLNAIIGFAELLGKAPPGDVSERYRDAAGHVLSSGHLLRLMIDDALDLAAIESGRVRLQMESVALEPLLQEVQLLSMPLAAKRGIALRGDTRVPWAVRADSLRLKQILLNLLSNAIKYNRSSGLVLLSVTRQEQHIRIQVADTGPGIPLELQDRLFAPFERLGKEHSGIEGTGIGLAICKRLAEAMGGEIGVSSIPGNGSRFWIDLPGMDVLEPLKSETRK